MPDPQHEELSRLFSLFRIADLNRRYYGCRAEQFERYLKTVEIFAGLSSAVALFLLLLLEASTVRFIAAALAGIALAATALPPLAGWSRKASETCNLHTLYSELFAAAESVIVQIRREGLTPEAVGASKLVHETHRRLQSKDEMEPDQELVQREEGKSREAFPPEYLYSNF